MRDTGCGIQEFMRTKGGVKGRRRHKRWIAQAKGYKWARSKKFRPAHEALMHAWTFAFRDRRKKKGVFRALWNIKINASSRAAGLTYSQLIPALKSKNIELNRKMLAELAEFEPKTFEEVVKTASKN